MTRTLDNVGRNHTLYPTDLTEEVLWRGMVHQWVMDPRLFLELRALGKLCVALERFSTFLTRLGDQPRQNHTHFAAGCQLRLTCQAAVAVTLFLFHPAKLLCSSVNKGQYFVLSFLAHVFCVVLEPAG